MVFCVEIGSEFSFDREKKEKAWEMVVLTTGLLWKISIFVLFCVLSRSKADESSKCHSNKCKFNSAFADGCLCLHNSLHKVTLDIADFRSEVWMREL